MKHPPAIGDVESLWEAFERTCRDHRDRLAVWSRSEGKGRSFAELFDDATELSLRFAGGRKETVGLAVGNRIELLSLFFALRRCDLPVAMIDGGLSAAEAERLCRRLGITRLIRRRSARRDGGHSGRQVIDLGAGIVLRSVDHAEASAIAGGASVVKVTSGSTGEPAGICLDDRALLSGISQIASGMEIDARDTLLLAIPLSHSYGFDHGVLSLAYAGATLVLESSIYPTALLRALTESGATFFPAVPPMVRALAETEWPVGLALERVISAGGPVAARFADAFFKRSGRPVHQFYGSSETGGISYERSPLDPDARGTVGHPLPGVSIELGEDGAVVVDSPANFIAPLGGPRRAERPVRLGDHGAWSPGGRLRLVGRTADLLNVGGRRVSAAAVESALLSLAGVEEAAVVGVADELRGDRVVAFVVARGPVDPSSLPTHLRPREIRSIDRLPFTERGKVDKSRLRSLAKGTG